jgi:hypothetical protein
MSNTTTATTSATAAFTDHGIDAAANTAKLGPNGNHFMLNREPGDLVIACWALEKMAQFAENLGSPISKKQAKEWLNFASDPCEGWGRDNREGWTNFRLDGIGELI